MLGTSGLMIVQNLQPACPWVCPIVSSKSLARFYFLAKTSSSQTNQQSSFADNCSFENWSSDSYHSGNQQSIQLHDWAGTGLQQKQGNWHVMEDMCQ